MRLYRYSIPAMRFQQEAQYVAAASERDARRKVGENFQFVDVTDECFDENSVAWLEQKLRAAGFSLDKRVFLCALLEESLSAKARRGFRP